MHVDADVFCISAGVDLHSRANGIQPFFASVPSESVRGFWNAGGIEASMRILLSVTQLTASSLRCPVTFGEFLKVDGGLPSSLYIGAVLLYGATSVCQVSQTVGQENPY